MWSFKDTRVELDLKMRHILDIDKYLNEFNIFWTNFQKVDKVKISTKFFNMFKKHFVIELIFDEKTVGPIYLFV